MPDRTAAIGVRVLVGHTKPDKVGRILLQQVSGFGLNLWPNNLNMITPAVKDIFG